MDEGIAKLSLIGVSSTGWEFLIEVTVGKPRLHEGHWICSVAVLGLDSRARDIYGGDSLQALTLGLRHVACQLRNFVEVGGWLLDPESREPFPLRAYFSEPDEA